MCVRERERLQKEGVEYVIVTGTNLLRYYMVISFLSLSLVLHCRSSGGKETGSVKQSISHSAGVSGDTPSTI